MTWTPQSILDAVVAEAAKFRAMNRAQLMFYGRLHHKTIAGFTAYKTALAVVGIDFDTVPVAIAKKTRKPEKPRHRVRPSRSKGVPKRPRDNLLVLTREALMDARLAGQSNAQIAKKYGFKSSQIKQRCYKLSVPTQIQLGQRPSQSRVRHWDTDKVFSASEETISAAFSGEKFEDDRRAVGDGRGPRYRPPAHQSYTGCAAAMCAG